MLLRSKRLILTLTAILILALTMGCSKSSTSSSLTPSKQPKVHAQAQTKAKLKAQTQTLAQGSSSSQLKLRPSPTPYTEKLDRNLTNKLRNESIVQSGKIYIKGDQAIATITVKKGTFEKMIKDVSVKYATSLKQKYKDKKVNVIAYREGIEMVNIKL
jgi:hypothetical protein